ncbi:MAG: 4Fe-4S binding protein [Clostridia bacterium]|nr:4Fe-4S binding protein [Clostridia bacterium]
MKEFKKAIEEFAKKEGIDLIGYADKSRFADVDSQHNPFSIFPQAKTVILVGKRICRGSLRGVEEGSNFGDYQLFGKNWLEDEFLALSAYNLTNFIEENGWEAVPVFPNPSEIEPAGVAVAAGKPEPNVYPDFDYAAVACGVCTISYNRIPFSKQFGSRQRFHMILTDAELESSPLLEENVCNSCRKCADVCPLGAISKTETEEIEICGKRFTVGKIDYEKCKICQNGAVANRFSSDAKPDRIAALCNRTCMCELEERGVLTNVFENKFRTSEVWSIGGSVAEIDRRDEQANVLGGEFSKTGKRGHK